MRPFGHEVSFEVTTHFLEWRLVTMSQFPLAVDFHPDAGNSQFDSEGDGERSTTTRHYLRTAFQAGSIPLWRMAASATGEVRNSLRLRAASCAAPAVCTPIENTVMC